MNPTTPEIMTKEEILRHQQCGLDNSQFESVLIAMEDFKNQELAEMREKLEMAQRLVRAGIRAKAELQERFDSVNNMYLKTQEVGFDE